MVFANKLWTDDTADKERIRSTFQNFDDVFTNLNFFAATNRTAKLGFDRYENFFDPF
jgi:hypothetical protein